jgi:hypothetical protein
MARQPRIPRLLACGSYHLGHEVHYIQARLSREGEPRAGTVTVGDFGWLTISFDVGGRQRLWNHDPDRLRALLARTEGRAGLRSSGVLAVKSRDGHYCVSVATEESPCPDPAEDVETLTLDELMRSRNGFLLTAEAVDALLARSEARQVGE